MSIKPILCNTDTVRAILDNRKTVTRRVVKEPYYIDDEESSRVSGLAIHRGTSMTDRMPYPDSLYHPGDILYVRETWCKYGELDAAERVIPETEKYYYRADGENPTPFNSFLVQHPGWDEYREVPVWRPSIHMPREAARIFLRVTDVRVERLQDPFFKHGSTIFALKREGVDIGGQCRECIETCGSPCCIDDESECGILDELRGGFADLWDHCYAKPRPIKDEDGTIDHYESYPWENIQETRTYRGKPWYVIGNPWVWVIEFERCEKPRKDD